MEETMRDWPESLKLSFESDRLASMIYYCKNQIWPVDGKLWIALSPASKNLYRAIATQALMTCKPEAPKPNPGPPSALRLVTKC